MENEETVYEGKEPNQLIALALEKQADPATLEKLMDLQERWEAGNARKAFVAAMTAFKQEAPAVLIKGDKVDFNTSKGRTHYNYANLGSIVQEITALLGKYNLSASWETKQDEKDNVIVACHVTHVAGHRESVTLRGPADDSGNKNRIQAIGSTVTYLQRYTLLAALGLATGEDDDGRGGKVGQPVTMPQSKGKTTASEPQDNAQSTQAGKTTTKPMTAEQTKLWAVLVQVCGNDKEKAQARLKEITAFGTFAGYDSIYAVSDKAAPIARHKLEAELKTKVPDRDINADKNEELNTPCPTCKKYKDCEMLLEDCNNVNAYERI